MYIEEYDNLTMRYFLGCLTAKQIEGIVHCAGGSPAPARRWPELLFPPSLAEVIDIKFKRSVCMHHQIMRPQACYVLFKSQIKISRAIYIYM